MACGRLCAAVGLANVSVWVCGIYVCVDDDDNFIIATGAWHMQKSESAGICEE